MIVWVVVCVPSLIDLVSAISTLLSHSFSLLLIVNVFNLPFSHFRTRKEIKV